MKLYLYSFVNSIIAYTLNSFLLCYSYYPVYASNL